MKQWIKRCFIGIESICISLLGIASFVFALREIPKQPQIMLPVSYVLYLIIAFAILYFFGKSESHILEKIWVKSSIIVILGWIPRVVILVFIGIEQKGDYGVYLEIADKLKAGFDIPNIYYGIFPHALHYSVFLRAMYDFLGEGIRTVKGVHLFFSGVEILFGYLLIQRFVEEKRAMYYGLIIALQPLSIVSVLFTAGETIYVVFVLIALYVASFIYEKESMPKGKNQWGAFVLTSLLVGSVLGIAEYFRPTAIIILIAIGIVEVFFVKDKIKVRIIRIVSICLPYILLTMIATNIIAGITGYEKPNKSFGWNLYVGGNYETKGEWNSVDGALFHQKIEEGNSPDKIQEFFYEKAVDRYIELITSRQLLHHFYHKLGIWQSDDYVANAIIEWQTGGTRYPSKEARDTIELVFFFAQVPLFFGMLLCMILRRIKKEDTIVLDITGLYIVGILLLHLLLETSTRYKLSYYSTIGLYTIFAGGMLYEKYIKTRNWNRILGRE